MVRNTRSSYRGPRNKGRGSKKTSRTPWLLAGGSVLTFSIAAVIFFSVQNRQKPLPETTQEQTETASLPEADMSINGISIKGMNQEQAFQAVMEQYPWNLSVSYGDETVSIPNLLEPELKLMLDEIFSEQTAGAYTIDFEKLREPAQKEAAALASKWDVSPKQSILDHYDKETDRFIFTESCSGTAIDQEQVVEDLLSALEKGELNATIEAEPREVAAGDDADIKASYETLATFTTTTTDNAKRNTNVKLSANALNGTVVLPGQEFSFNATVGQRTEEKGYQMAAAYNSGEVVQEVGGGVCQISSTLYRTAFKAGMKISFRRSHTFEPNYVTPGQDATISWDQPDFRFINTSPYPIGIRASYADKKATVSIYGVPVLEKGVTWDLYSEKTADTDPPEPTYIEDPTLTPGTEKVEKAGSPGSTWITYKVVSKDGQEVERIKDHEKTYKGHSAVIRRNTGSSALPSNETQTTAPTVDGMPDSYIPGQDIVLPETSGEMESQQEQETIPETLPVIEPFDP